MMTYGEVIVLCVLIVSILIGFMYFIYTEYKTECFDKIREDADEERNQKFKQSMSKTLTLNEARSFHDKKKGEE